MAVFLVLGALHAGGEDGPIELGGPRQRSVLGRLLVARGQVVPLERLISDLWSDQPPPGAVASVQAYVSNLRRALEPRRTARTPGRVLVTVPPGYALRAEHVDAWRFEDLVREGSRSLAEGDAAGAVRALDAALALWNGPAYMEFAAANWAVGEIARLGELRAAAVEQRASAVMALGSPGGAVADLRAHLAEHPLREEGWRLLSIALYRQGRQGDALGALREARRTLAAELGVDPGPALRRLEADILAHAPELDPLPGSALPRLEAAALTRPSEPGLDGPSTPRPQGGAFARPSAPGPLPRAGDADPRLVTCADPIGAPTGAPTTAALSRRTLPRVPVRSAGGVRLFGRQAELSLLLGLSRGVALVTGEAGIGKSALVEAVAAARAGQGWRVASGRCPPTRGAPPGWPWAEILRALAAAVPPSGETAGPLAPLLGPLLGPRAAAGGPGERFRTRRALAAHLLEAASAAPILLVVEDLHQADRETRDTLVQVVAETAGAPVVVIGTFREEEAGRLAGTLAALARHEPLRIGLRGLRLPAAAGLLAAVAGTRVSRPALTALAARTGGNPFYLRETGRLLAAEGEAAALSAVPAGVRDVLAARLAALPEPVRTVLAVAAVLCAGGTGAGGTGDVETAGGKARDGETAGGKARDGDPARSHIDVDVLAAVGGGEDAVVEALDAALRAGLLTESGGGLRFACALVHDTLYGELSRLRRSRVHTRIAAALQRPGEAAVLAHRHDLGAEPVRAARHALIAAAREGVLGAASHLGGPSAAAPRVARDPGLAARA